MTPAEPDNENETNWYLNSSGNQPAGNTPAGGEWNPYQASWTQSSSVVVQSQAVSALSILSMISGILSIPMMCLCFLSIPFSLFAIVSGHISRSICRRSQGRVTGDGMAIAGLILGYLSFVMTLGTLGWVFTARTGGPGFAPAPPIMGTPSTTAVDASQELNQAVAMVSLSMSSGNSDEATRLALHLQASLFDISQQLQAGSSPASDPATETNLIAESPAIIAELPESSGSAELQKALAQTSVYCALRTDTCAFLIVIPNLRDLNEADRITLSQMTWLAGGRTVKGHLREGDDFAVALVSKGLMDEISLGHHERSDHFDAGLEHRGPATDESRLTLEAFFEPAHIEDNVSHGEADTEVSTP